MRTYKALVVGGGPAGLAAACLLAKEGISTALIGNQPAPEARTVALMQPTLRMLSYINVWPGKLRSISAPLKRQRIVDDTGSLFVAPDMVFEARELGLDAFAWNIPLNDLIPALRAEAVSAGVELVEDKVIDATTFADRIEVSTGAGSNLFGTDCARR